MMKTQSGLWGNILHILDIAVLSVISGMIADPSHMMTVLKRVPCFRILKTAKMQICVFARVFRDDL